MPLAIAAHHDRKIRLYDLRAGMIFSGGYALENSC